MQAGIGVSVFRGPVFQKEGLRTDQADQADQAGAGVSGKPSPARSSVFPETPKSRRTETPSSLPAPTVRSIPAQCIALGHRIAIISSPVGATQNAVEQTPLKSRRSKVRMSKVEKARRTPRVALSFPKHRRTETRTHRAVPSVGSGEAASSIFKDMTASVLPGNSARVRS